MKEVFEDIVRYKKWTTSTCGPGSTIEYTANLRGELKNLLLRHGIKSMFDAPCGDYSWMSLVNVQEIVEYSGGDIVSFMVDECKKEYPGVNFTVFDITKDKLPDVDLLFCRDCLLHLSHADIDKVLMNFSSSNVKYLLTSNWFESAENTRDIENGDWRYINFLSSPYNFGEPIDSIKDFIHGFPRREMLLWPKEAVVRYTNNVFQHK